MTCETMIYAMMIFARMIYAMMMISDELFSLP